MYNNGSGPHSLNVVQSHTQGHKGLLRLGSGFSEAGTRTQCSISDLEMYVNQKGNAGITVAGPCSTQHGLVEAGKLMVERGYNLNTHRDTDMSFGQ